MCASCLKLAQAEPKTEVLAQGCVHRAKYFVENYFCNTNDQQLAKYSNTLIQKND
jgi:hypothetical protein